MNKNDLMKEWKKNGLVSFDIGNLHVQLLDNGEGVSVVENDSKKLMKAIAGKDVDPVIRISDFPSIDKAVDYALTIK